MSEQPEQVHEEASQAEQLISEAMTSDSILNSTDVNEEIEKLTLESKEADTSPQASAVSAPASAGPTTSHLDLTEDDEEDLDGEGAAEEKEEQEEKILRRHMNVVFIGHVDAGKSTISGHLMYLTGELDDRTLDKFTREAKSKNRESWKFAWALDTTDNERAKGKTEEVGRAMFQTANKRYTILDAPGHKNFVPHMIGGASQADVGILVISARKGEFEAGFEAGGQTREHAMLAKTVGLRQLVVLINKMDDSTVEWSKERYDECVNKLMPYLKQVGYNPKTDLYFLPGSGLCGYNLKERVTKEMCPWYSGPALLELLDEMKPPERLVTSALRMPISDKYKDMGTVVIGRIQSGTINKGQQLLVMPNKTPVEVLGIQIENFDVDVGEPGDNLKVKLKGIEEEEIRSGFVLCPLDDIVRSVRVFDAQVMIVEYKSIICAGYSAVLHIHSCIEECVFEELLAVIDRKTNTVIKKRPKFVKQGQTVLVRISVRELICVEEYKKFQQLGRFMIRDEGKTVGVGVITSLHTADSTAAPSTA
eukprot:TRINITY_DN861_c0_g1_i2.p1 TRINITY_DN861_c0_g1~~TRINITY_DN861_c0_g1_i2.p1  ORF type:complete len:535 (-),score=133.67 TRINITY_DN861_c0_g1_i2:476-2080(-)